MGRKYENSFNNDDIPDKCPICGTEFDRDEDIDHSPFKDGIRTMLYCSRCNYKKVLAYNTNNDIEKEMNELI